MRLENDQPHFLMQFFVRNGRGGCRTETHPHIDSFAINGKYRCGWPEYIKSNVCLKSI